MVHGLATLDVLNRQADRDARKNGNNHGHGNRRRKIFRDSDGGVITDPFTVRALQNRPWPGTSDIPKPVRGAGLNGEKRRRQHECDKALLPADQWPKSLQKEWAATSI